MPSLSAGRAFAFTWIALAAAPTALAGPFTFEKVWRSGDPLDVIPGATMGNPQNAQIDNAGT